MYKKYPEVFKNIPYFHKKDPSINIRTKFFSLELKNHHNYFSQESVKAQFFIFNIFRQI
jgi:hypothetical protein